MIETSETQSEEPDPYLSPRGVCELIPGMTVRTLADMRYRRVGPKYSKPGYKSVVYRKSDVLAWLRRREVITAD